MKQRSQVINDNILKSASHIFSKYGYEKATISMIAKEANVATGTIYIYFKNKDELLNFIYQDWRAKQYKFVMDNFLVDISPREQFSFLWNRLITFGLKHKDGLNFLEAHYQAPYLNEMSLSLWKNSNQNVISVIKDAQKKSYIKKIDAEVISSMVNGALRGLINDCELTDKIIEETEQCMWEAIRA